MYKSQPDHHDAEIVMRLYDLRREPVMREARRRIVRELWPRTAEEIVGVATNFEHPLNEPYRQVTTYYEMAYGMAKHGIAHPDYLLENAPEGLVVFSRVEPYLDALRAAASPRVLTHAEWMAGYSNLGRGMMETYRARNAKRLAAMKQ